LLLLGACVLAGLGGLTDARGQQIVQPVGAGTSTWRPATPVESAFISGSRIVEPVSSPVGRTVIATTSPVTAPASEPPPPPLKPIFPPDDGWKPGMDRLSAPPPPLTPPLRQASFGPDNSNVPRTGPAPLAANLTLSVIGPEHGAPGGVLPFELVVRNSGSTGVAGVRIEERLPDGIRLHSADPIPESQGDRLVWNVGTVEEHGERHLKVLLHTDSATEVILNPMVSFSCAAGWRTPIDRPATLPRPPAAEPATVAAPELPHGVVAVSEPAPSVPPARPASIIGLDVQVKEDHLEVGKDATLEIRITNQTAATLPSVRLGTVLPAGILLLGGEGPSKAEVKEPHVVFEPVSSGLAAHEQLVYRLKIRGHRTGDWPFRAEVLSEALPQRLEHEILVHVGPGKK
jgi:hypothetical protein